MLEIKLRLCWPGYNAMNKYDPLLLLRFRGIERYSPLRFVHQFDWSKVVQPTISYANSSSGRDRPIKNKPPNLEKTDRKLRIQQCSKLSKQYVTQGHKRRASDELSHPNSKKGKPMSWHI